MMRTLLCLVVFNIVLVVFCQNTDQLLSQINAIASEPNDTIKVVKLNALARDLSSRGYFKTSKEVIHTALKCNDSNTPMGRALCFESLAIVAVYEKDYYTSLKLFKKVIAIDDSVKSSEGMASVYNNIAFVFIEIGQRGFAIKSLEKALQIYWSSSHYSGVASVLHNMGLFYENTDPEKAKHYFLLSGKIFHYLNDPRNSFYSLSKISSCDFKLNNSGFRNSHQAAIQYGLSNSLNNDIGRYYIDIASIINERGGADSALMWLDSAVLYSLKGTDYLCQYDAYSMMGNILQEKGNDDCVLYFEKAMGIAKEINSTAGLRTAASNLTGYFSRSGNFKTALLYSEKQIELNNNENKKTIDFFEELLKYTLLDKDLRNLELQRAQKSAILNLVILIAVIVFISLLIVLILQNKTIRAHKKIVEQNIDFVNKEKELQWFKENRNETESEKTESEKTKYTGSSLSENKKNELLDKLEFQINHNKIFLNKELSIRDVADALQTNSKYLSQIINETFNCSFINYINDYRIKEARIMLSEPASLKYTIEYISGLVGFKSKSSFNIAFKKQIGVTPTFYIQTTKAIYQEKA